MTERRLGALFCALLLCSGLTPAKAHEGHDDEAPQAAAPSETSAPPSAALTLDAPPLELVARREGDRLLLYFDDYASNAPLDGLEVAVLAGSRRIAAAAQGEGVYTVPADLLDGPGAQTLTLAVHGKGLDTQLSGELPEAPVEDRAAKQTHIASAALLTWGAILVAAAALALAFVLAVSRSRRATRRRIDLGGVAAPSP